jgi:hypothetical protein
MQKQWFLFGSAVSIAFVLVILGGIFGNSLARKPSGDLAAQIPTQLESPQPAPATDAIRKFENGKVSENFESNEEHGRSAFGEHAEEREED